MASKAKYRKSLTSPERRAPKRAPDAPVDEARDSDGLDTPETPPPVGDTPGDDVNAATTGDDPVSAMIDGAVEGRDVSAPSADIGAAVAAVDAARQTTEGLPIFTPGAVGGMAPDAFVPRAGESNEDAERRRKDERNERDRQRRAERAGGAAPRPRGRPRKDGLPPGSVHGERAPVAPQLGTRPDVARMTKAELAAELDAERAQRAQLAARVAGIEAAGNVELIAQLAAAISFATQAACDVWADTERAPVLRASDEEADTVGHALAPVMAPYADVLAPAIPWGVALNALWRLYRAKMEALRLYRAEQAQGARVSTTPSS